MADQLEAVPSTPTTPAAGGHDSSRGSDSGAVARPKTFIEKVKQLGYAPRDLFVIYSIKFAESCAYFAFSYIYAPFLSEEFDMSDVEAGCLYALYGVLCSVVGLFAGPVIDSLDVRSALLLGTVPSFLGRFGSALTRSTDVVYFCNIVLLPLGAAFGLPVFALAVRRFTHPENRAFAFTIFYAVLCLSSAAGGFVISFARATFRESGLDLPWPFSCHLTWMRVNVLMCAGFTFYTCAAACTIRNASIQQNVPLEQAKLEQRTRISAARGAKSWAERRRVAQNYMRVVYGNAAFWRLLSVSLIVALGTRATFRHLDATFPKYFMRTFGEDAPFELFAAIEPFLTVTLSFPVTYLLLRHRFSTYQALVVGTFVQSFCPIALLWSSYGNTLAFVSIMALGEAIWSPRLYEYSTMVAPEGYEGTFVAVAFVPQYVSAGVVGITSGYLLDSYCPEELEPGETRKPHILWGTVAIASFVTPALLVLFKRGLFAEEPTLQADTQTVAVRSAPKPKGGQRARGNSAGRYAMAVDESARSEYDAELDEIIE
jgi:MFS family permease